MLPGEIYTPDEHKFFLFHSRAECTFVEWISIYMQWVLLRWGLTFIRCLLTHFVNVFFWTRSRSSEEGTDRSLRKSTTLILNITAESVSDDCNQMLQMFYQSVVESNRRQQADQTHKERQSLSLALSLSTPEEAAEDRMPAKLLGDGGQRLSPPPRNSARA